MADCIHGRVKGQFYDFMLSWRMNVLRPSLLGDVDGIEPLMTETEEIYETLDGCSTLTRLITRDEFSRHISLQGREPWQQNSMLIGTLPLRYVITQKSTVRLFTIATN
jgi:hypothetical protein